MLNMIFHDCLVLAENIWSGKTVAGFPIVAEYIEPVDEPPEIEPPSEEWKRDHVRQSQYLLQIVKCGKACCGPLRSTIRDVLAGGFLPSPFKIQQTDKGLLSIIHYDILLIWIKFHIFVLFFISFVIEYSLFLRTLSFIGFIVLLFFISFIFTMFVFSYIVVLKLRD